MENSDLISQNIEDQCISDSEMSIDSVKSDVSMVSSKEFEDNFFCTAINKINDFLTFIGEKPLKLRTDTRSTSQKIAALHSITHSIATKVFSAFHI